MRRVGGVSEGVKCVRKMTMSMCATVNSIYLCSVYVAAFHG